MKLCSRHESVYKRSTMKKSTRPLVSVLWFSVACGDSVRQSDADGGARGEGDASADAGHDASDDAQSQPDDSDASDTCRDYAKKVTAFAETHGSCATSDDCVVVGSCSNADFVAVSASSEQEATALVDGRPSECKAQDGPTYDPVCFEGQCQKLGSLASCGGPQVNTSCPAGLAFHREGCSPQVPFAQGCYASCDPDATNTCPAGTLCQQTTSNDCIAGTDCTGCGSSVSLCLPEPDCEVWLSVEFQGGARQVSVFSEVAEINLVAENRTGGAVHVTYIDWCHGPVVQGLSGYDAWNSCVKGNCAAVEVETTLTLAARERRVVATALASPLPSTCNPNGLAKGNYLLSWQLLSASGAKVCILPASELRAGEPAAP